MKVKLIPVKNFGRDEYRPANKLAENIASWLDKKHLSARDKRCMQGLGFDVIILEYKE